MTSPEICTRGPRRHPFPRATPIVQELLLQAQAGTLFRANIEAHSNRTRVAMHLVWDGWLTLGTYKGHKGRLDLTDLGREWLGTLKTRS